MRAPKDTLFVGLVSPPKRRPGRPRLPRAPAWKKIRSEVLSAEALEYEEEEERLWRWQRRGGRPPKQQINQSLLDGWRAKPQGMTKRAFVRKWFRQWHGRAATLDEVQSVERQIDRLLKK